MKKKICLIGNEFGKKGYCDGQTIKTRLYHELLLKEGFEVLFVDTYEWKKHLVKLLFKLCKYYKKSDIVLLMTGAKGSRKFTYLVNFLNKKKKKRFVHSVIGTGFLSEPLKKLSFEEAFSFLNEKKYHLIDDHKIQKQLNKIDVICSETEKITNLFESYYSLKNCITIPNFRLDEEASCVQKDNARKFVYLSRVNKRKGVLDLLTVFDSLSKKYKNITLDIYGPLELSSADKILFNSLLSDKIHYNGVVESSKVIKVIKDYDCFVFPTLCPNEGMPGAIAESLIAGVPIISSNFPQSHELLSNGKNSILYEFGNSKALKKVLEKIILDTELYKNLVNGAYESGKKYSYSFWREMFLSFIDGEKR